MSRPVGYYRDRSGTHPVHAPQRYRRGRMPHASGPIKIKHKGSLEGWHHTQSTEVRREHLREAERKHGYASTERKLNALTILDENRNPNLARIAEEDKHWLEQTHPKVDGGRDPPSNGTLNDPHGTKNVEWEEYIPEYPDGTVSLANAGFVNTSHGTSCAGCRYFVGGNCRKIHGYPKVEPGNCCNYHVDRRNPSESQRVRATLSYATNKNLE